MTWFHEFYGVTGSRMDRSTHSGYGRRGRFPGAYKLFLGLLTSSVRFLFPTFFDSIEIFVFP